MRSKERLHKEDNANSQTDVSVPETEPMIKSEASRTENVQVTYRLSNKNPTKSGTLRMSQRSSSGSSLASHHSNSSDTLKHRVDTQTVVWSLLPCIFETGMFKIELPLLCAVIWKWHCFHLSNMYLYNLIYCFYKVFMIFCYYFGLGFFFTYILKNPWKILPIFMYCVISCVIPAYYMLEYVCIYMHTNIHAYILVKIKTSIVIVWFCL